METYYGWWFILFARCIHKNVQNCW
jgi:hypothetical protein